mmetsp:Transcript_22255/g.44637  ORF Transcript_22255/g.44637 Transcript_22255/m.44637 type:complete len:97 (-) Transcript_22255:885-1175(-)
MEVGADVDAEILFTVAILHHFRQASSTLHVIIIKISLFLPRTRVLRSHPVVLSVRILQKGGMNDSHYELRRLRTRATPEIKETSRYAYVSCCSPAT